MSTDVAEFPVSPAGRGRWRLKVWVQPGAKRHETAGFYQGSLKVRLAAPAVDNKANKALVGYVAELLGLKARQVVLDTGRTTRQKTVLIESECEPDWRLMLPGEN